MGATTLVWSQKRLLLQTIVIKWVFTQVITQIDAIYKKNGILTTLFETYTT